MERFVNHGDITQWTTSTAAPVNVLLFNGGPGCDDYLGPIAEMLAGVTQDPLADGDAVAGDADAPEVEPLPAETDISLRDKGLIIRFEPRGCGRSMWHGPYDLETTIADAECIREAYGIERWIVAGHSAGVDYAMAYGIAYPANTQGLIGLSGGRIVNDRDWSATYHERKAATLENMGGLVFTSDPDVNRTGNLSWRAYIKRPDLLRDIARIPFPCAFINASADIRDNWPTRQLAELIPRAIYSEILGAGHMSWLTHPTEVRKSLHHALAMILKCD